MKYSVIIPVYKNEASIPSLLRTLNTLSKDLHHQMEAVFVIDGSPDNSATLLCAALEACDFSAQILMHSRNFGAFAAIRTGLQAARGQYFAVMAADLQEPPELIMAFFQALSQDECDVAMGTRSVRHDPWSSRLASRIFWGLYRRLVMKEMPSGGVDIFGCNLQFRDHLLRLEESRSSLIALIFWLGFRRKFISYERKIREQGKSAWTLRKKIDYMMDSIFSFTDFPIRLLTRVGAMSSLFAFVCGLLIIIARLTGLIDVPGYAATIVTVLFFGALNLFGLGLIGTYAWRGYENSKQRPQAIVASWHKNKMVKCAAGQMNPGEIEDSFSRALQQTVVTSGHLIGVGKVSFHHFKLAQDPRGDLSVGEFLKEIPFIPKRYFLVCNVPEGKIRGEHAHYKCHQFLICVKGACSVVVDDGTSRKEIRLEQPNQGLYLPPLTWGVQYHYTPDAVLMVFASDYYDNNDYIRDYQQFCEVTRQLGEYVI
ncbi:MAG TPA: WxcM-like domain-containing protein [Legionellaceae bacterium]|nr:WxcM-like domain-containing protein [Legionellaceae bacterium]